MSDAELFERAILKLRAEFRRRLPDDAPQRSNERMKKQQSILARLVDEFRVALKKLSENLAFRNALCLKGFVS
ncbi:hypothetical protein OJF2_65170 [Aquisphaera giovannonii]|uniref:Uncharacterized protein n=1 Tax=Aquisphaera giovannonii TaxID=406548 RepID=A0A5B9WBH7_9BACT|nr:hypothetical protein [Aquisphaera giovannonii]QEH37922.1 hypothetical protein OJF2_65170 [Aquisphaera giovannonii]